MTNYCGYIALVGRPNVGKSTLLNRLLHQKISITSRKPQTTRHKILGINTIDAYQYVYVDTPGIHTNAEKSINRMMNKTAKAVLSDVDAVVMVVEALQWRDEDELVLKLIKAANIPCVLAVNKVDKVKEKETLLPWLESVSQYHNFETILPLSAKTGAQVEKLQQLLQKYLPEGPHLFPEDQLTDRSTRFLCAEMIREKIFRLCGQEIPYSTSIDIESYKEEENLIRIHALILVDKESHKRILIGNKGEKMKEIASAARLDMEKLLEKKVFLRCWCKIKSGWADDERLLRQLGYDN